MSNIIDYLKWRGDLTFDRDPVNMIDCLLFAQLSYLQWELIWQDGETSTLNDLYSRIADREYAITFTAKEDREMLPIAAQTKRFGTIPMSDLICHLDEEAEEQFAAVTYHLPDGTLFVAFRGTDCSLVGWREDFRMACQPEVPAQRHAADYLGMIAKLYEGNIRIAGHSKGGNLAVYAAATAAQAVQARLLDVCNFDGPGQNDALFASPGYNRLTTIRTIVPASSIIGMLMRHPAKMDAVTCNVPGIYQHDPYSWQLCGTHFILADTRNNDSIYYEKVFERWLNEIDLDERTAFVDTIFDILASTKARSFGPDFFQSLLQHPGDFLSSFSNVTKENWQKVSKVIGALAGSAVENGISMSPAAKLVQPDEA